MHIEVKHTPREPLYPYQGYRQVLSSKRKLLARGERWEKSHCFGCEVVPRAAYGRVVSFPCGKNAFVILDQMTDFFDL